MKNIIDNYVDNVKRRSEFDTQQKITNNIQKQKSCIYYDWQVFLSYLYKQNFLQ